MTLKIDPKLVAVASIILGLFLGFYVNNTFLSRPRIETLTNQTIQQQEAIDGLGDKLATLRSEIDALEALNSELEENSVPMGIHDALQDEADAKDARIAELEAQMEELDGSVDDLEGQLATLEDQLDTLGDDYTALLRDHDRLQERFDEVYNPGYVEFTANGLDFNLTVTKTSFESHIPIVGTVSIRHGDGSLFEGIFKLRITKVYLNLGTTSDEFYIHGETDYSWSGAFISGAGSYRLSISEVLDSQGGQAVPSTELRANYISIFIG
jgi:uncharacterized coiled-coil protein SlyX